MSKDYPSKPRDLEVKIEEWRNLNTDNLKIDWINNFKGQRVYAITITDFSIKTRNKIPLYIAQPHAHEPATTVGMIDVIEQLLTGKDLYGEKSDIDVERVLSTKIVTFNPIGNPDGSERLPVDYWDGRQYTNEQLWCWMRGEDPEKPGKYWKRVDIFDTRREKNLPKRIGVVYEQIDNYHYVEPNRSKLSSYYKIFSKMNATYNYRYWLDLHQTEFREKIDCKVFLYLPNLDTEEIHRENIEWANYITKKWEDAGFNPGKPSFLDYSGEEAELIRRAWGEIHRKLHRIAVEVINNTNNPNPREQARAESVAIKATLERGGKV